MPIKTLQKRLAEIGRLRMGRQVPTRNGKTRPERLADWRLTSPHQGLLEYARDLYGGTIQPWQGAPTEHAQYELYTDSPALKVLIPPGQIVSQWMEAWSGGGCKRRCDGEREYLADQPCVCQQENAHPRDYMCKPTTRLNVILRDVPAVGVWRLEIHGYYGAVELAGMAQLLEDAGLSGRLVPAELRIEQRTIKRPGEPPKHFAVPVLSPESAWIELAASQQRAALEAAPLELEAPAYDEETGEYYGPEDSPTGGSVTPTPDPPVATTPSVPTLEQIKKLRTPEAAEKLIRQAGEEFGALVVRAVLALNDAAISTREQARDWWSLASPKDRREVLEYAVELHDHQQHETKMSAAAHSPRAAADHTSGAGRAEHAEFVEMDKSSGEGSADPATTPAPDSPTLLGGDT